VVWHVVAARVGRCGKRGAGAAGHPRTADLGLVYARLGRHQQAADHQQQALGLFREMGDRSGEAETLNSLGEALLARASPTRPAPSTATRSPSPARSATGTNRPAPTTVSRTPTVPPMWTTSRVSTGNTP
jgi:hypothetical protein